MPLVLGPYRESLIKWAKWRVWIHEFDSPWCHVSCPDRFSCWQGPIACAHPTLKTFLGAYRHCIRRLWLIKNDGLSVYFFGSVVAWAAQRVFLFRVKWRLLVRPDIFVGSTIHAVLGWSIPASWLCKALSHFRTRIATLALNRCPWPAKLLSRFWTWWVLNEIALSLTNEVHQMVHDRVRPGLVSFASRCLLLLSSEPIGWSLVALGCGVVLSRAAAIDEHDLMRLHQSSLESTWS